MNKLGHLFLCPKVEKEYDQVQHVTPMRILTDEFCGKKNDKDDKTPFTADFAFHDNKLYIVAIN